MTDYGISSQGDYGSPSRSDSGGITGVSQTGANVGGIAPVVIGGYKSDGSASVTNIPTIVTWAAIGIGVVALLAWLHSRRK